MDNYQTVYTSPIGDLILESTANGISRVEFLKANEQVEINNHPVFDLCKSQLDAYFSGALRHFDLPLAPSGTPFQQLVWQSLVKINYGTTISYKQQALQLGDVKQIRAMASANGKNKIAIIIPCHRVIGSNQSLVGYAGGLARKKWLLEWEQSQLGNKKLF